MTEFIKPADIEWKQVKYLRQGQTFEYDYHLWLNEPLASWDVWDYWERERIESMRTHLKQGDILFDIGTEQGWCNLVYAQMVGPENMVLIEPTAEFWPNIKALWEKNFGKQPLGFYDGLMSDETTEQFVKGDTARWRRWPAVSSGDLIDRNKYVYLHEEHQGVPEITLDDYVTRTGIIPTALTMDTEGSELLILRGAEDTLRRHRPKLFISIHPDLGERDYGVKPQQVHDYLTALGYSGEHLATDHEEHWYFSQ